MAVTIDTKLSPPFISVVARCTTWAEAMAACRAVESVEPAAFAPAIALIDGMPVTGGGHVSHHADPGPDLPPAAAALAELQSDEVPLNGPDNPGEAAP